MLELFADCWTPDEERGWTTYHSLLVQEITDRDIREGRQFLATYLPKTFDAADRVVGRSKAVGCDTINVACQRGVIDRSPFGV